jgi:hypothetical protein
MLAENSPIGRVSETQSRDHYVVDAGSEGAMRRVKREEIVVSF